MTDLPFSASRTKVSWFKDGHPINTANPIISTRIQIFGQYSEQLKINSVRPEDVGLYQCFLTTNTAQEFQAASELRLGGRCCANLPIFYFKLKYFKHQIQSGKINDNSLHFSDARPTLLYSFIDQTLQPGPWVSLKCSADGSPTPEIKWTVNGFNLPMNER